MSLYLFENHPDPMWIYDPGTLKLLDVNGTAVEKFGYSRAELLSRTIADIRPPEDVPALLASVRRLESGFYEGGRWRLRTKGGDLIDVDIRWHVIEHEGKKAILASVRDISAIVEMERERDALLERERQARLAAEESADHFRSMFEAAPADARNLKAANKRLKQQDAHLRTAQRLLGLGMWSLNLDSGALVLSDSGYELFGVDRETFSSDFQGLLGLVHPDDRQRIQALYQGYQESHDPVIEFEYRMVRPTGEILQIRGVGELAANSAGRVYTGVMQDVTRQKRAEADLIEANTLIRIAGQAASLGGWRVDLATRHVTWSPVTAEIHEIDVSQTPDLDSAIEFYAPEYRDRVLDLFTACAERGHPYDEVLQIVTGKGNRVWVRSIGEAEYDADGAIQAVRGAFQDISELVAAQQRTAGLSQRLLQTLESMSDAVFMLDTDWRFTFLNGQAEILLSRGRKDLVGRRIWEEFPDAVGMAFQTQYERAASTRKAARFVEYFPPLAKWFEVSAYPAPDGLAVYFRDITEKRAREEQLRLLEAAVSRQNDLLIITEATPIDEPDGPRIVYVNDAFVRRTGYSRDEVLGWSPRFLQGPETGRRELDTIRRAMENNESVRVELVNYTRDGDPLWLDIDISPIVDEAGHHTHFVAVERDITARKRTEEAIRISEERFRLVAKATNDVIFDWNFEADTIWWNEGLVNHFGGSVNGSVMSGDVTMEPGSAWMNRIHADDREHVMAAVRTVTEGAAASWNTEYRFAHAEGHYLTVYSRGFAIRNDTGDTVRMLGSLTDITEQRQLDERLRQSQKLEAVGQLTGGVAHDFNNLLTVILGNAEILVERLQNQTQLRSMADMMVTAAERGADLTNRLLAFARRQALEPKRINVNRVVASMDGLLRRTLSEEISLEIVQAGGLWTTEVDAGQLEVAMLNLALNARDAMPDGGFLTIETANTVLDDAYARAHQEVIPGQYVMISISDTGLGMGPDVASRAVEPFFTTKEVGKGSGLGLSMIYGFVKQSDGHMKIYTETGEGTTVRLYFPRVYARPSDDERKAADPRPVGGNEHILVVEDDDLVREHLIARLMGLGYRVTGATNGVEAMEIVKNTSGFDLLFTDVVMPGGINGRQLARFAQDLYPELRVLFTSGYTENAIVHHGRLDPGVHLLSKPYRYQELSAKIRKVLDENGDRCPLK